VLTHGFVLDEQSRKMAKSLGNVTAPQEVADKFGVDILRLWAAMSDTTEDLKIGQEILKQQAELYRRLRNTLRWLLGSLDGFTDAEKLPYAEMPELERYVLHRLTELDARLRRAAHDYDWRGVYPELHVFCATDLSAFYFDIRKDALYCDRPDNKKRRASRTVLDILHRCLTTWLAPSLCFTAEEAWVARFGEESSVHLQTWPEIPAEWRNDALASRWVSLRAARGVVTNALEASRQAGLIGASLQAAVTIAGEGATMLEAADWEELAIISQCSVEPGASPLSANVTKAVGEKCLRCWRVLPEVGQVAAHPALCRRCADAVEHRVPA
jgi:isoleucyl-tRNA synthetase